MVSNYGLLLYDSTDKTTDKSSLLLEASLNNFQEAKLEVGLTIKYIYLDKNNLKLCHTYSIV